MAIKCQTCNGLYDAVSADGTAFFHACAPLRRLRVQELDGSYSTVAPGAEAGRTIVGERFVERPNKRDENVRRDPVTGAVAPIAAGAGVAVVADNLKT